MTKTKTMEKMRNVNKPLSHKETRELLLEGFIDIGLRKEHFGLHSLHSGGAALAANKGVKDRSLKRHGR